jgi:hypothetical protein
MKILCTFSGKFGDILWSLPTVREIAKKEESYTVHETNYLTEVHFGIMPEYRSLIPLLNSQNYIDKAFVIEDWICIGSPHGDQPWESPVTERYDKVYHLTYKQHPTKNQPLLDFTASQQGIQLLYNGVIPFISLPWTSPKVERQFIAYAFNESMMEYKGPFLQKLKEEIEPLGVDFIDISKIPWLNAATLLNSVECLAFVGCRSANYVLACGLGKRVFVYEPNISRSMKGPFGTTFTCPYANETEVTSVEVIKDEINKMLKELIT